MKPLTAVIVEDEAFASDMLKFLLQTYFPDIIVVGMAARVSEALPMIEVFEPDIVFLDIELPEVSGLELHDQLPTDLSHLPFIIYTSANDSYRQSIQHQSRAFFLTKPIQVSHLKNILQAIVSANE